MLGGGSQGHMGVPSKPKYCDFEVGVTRSYGFETTSISSGEHTEHMYQVWCTHYITKSDPAYVSGATFELAWSRRRNIAILT